MVVGDELVCVVTDGGSQLYPAAGPFTSQQLSQHKAAFTAQFAASSDGQAECLSPYRQSGPSQGFLCVAQVAQQLATTVDDVAQSIAFTVAHV
ncbi:hypothetical protein EB796_024298 [Bugula neritina]|uniref:Uncharacterized protein n=1 Tax=Bugula neritina TaxID=10212 RepID=A0A7J7IVF3_BUGNE|nr:hypothetical protein EB796_024298 [Bugula neritina]